MFNFSFHNFGCEVYSETKQYFEMTQSAAISSKDDMHYCDGPGKHTSWTKGLPGHLCIELWPPLFDLCVCRVCFAVESNVIASCSDTIYQYKCNMSCCTFQYCRHVLWVQPDRDWPKIWMKDKENASTTNNEKAFPTFVSECRHVTFAL